MAPVYTDTCELRTLKKLEDFNIFHFYFDFFFVTFVCSTWSLFPNETHNNPKTTRTVPNHHIADIRSPKIQLPIIACSNQKLIKIVKVCEIGKKNNYRATIIGRCTCNSSYYWAARFLKWFHEKNPHKNITKYH